MESTYETKVVNPSPNVDENMLNKNTELKDVLSDSCLVRYDEPSQYHGLRDCAERESDKKIVGSAITVRLRPGDIVDCHFVFTVIKPGDVVVIDAFGENTTSIWGGLMSGIARNAGVVGAVIDASCRDTDESKMPEFPLHARWAGSRAGTRPAINEKHR